MFRLSMPSPSVCLLLPFLVVAALAAAGDPAKSFQVGAPESYLNRVNLKETAPTTTKIWRTTSPASDRLLVLLTTPSVTSVGDDLWAPGNGGGNLSGQHGNKTRMEILEEHLGPQKKPVGFVVCMSTVYILILICGLVGNISTCCVIICNNCMHTTTNYYLFSLAVSDVLSLITGECSFAKL